MPETSDPLEGGNPFESMSSRDLTVLRLIIRQEVAAGVGVALGDVKARQDSLETTVCGAPGSETAGLLSRVQTLETKATMAQWLAGMALGSSIAAMAGLIVAMLTHQIHF